MEDDTMRPEMEFLKELAKERHTKRVAQTPDRIEYDIKRLEEEGIEYKIKNRANGHFHIFNKKGQLFQFWASTGKIWFDMKVRVDNGWKHDKLQWRGIESVIKLIKESNEIVFLPEEYYY